MKPHHSFPSKDGSFQLLSLTVRLGKCGARLGDRLDLGKVANLHETSRNNKPRARSIGAVGGELAPGVSDGLLLSAGTTAAGQGLNGPEQYANS